MNVGLIMRVKREWFDAVPLHAARSTPWPLVKTQLEEQFAFPNPARKTLQILRTIWYDNADVPPNLLVRGANVWLEQDKQTRGIIHTLLTVKAFPVVLDIVSVIAHEFRFKDTVSAKQLRAQLLRRFGEDGSLNAALPKITTTLSQLDLFDKGVNLISRRKPSLVQSAEAVSWCFECMIEILGREPMPRKLLEKPEFLLGHTFHLNHETISASEEHLELFISGSREQIIAIR